MSNFIFKSVSEILYNSYNSAGPFSLINTGITYKYGLAVLSRSVEGYLLCTKSLP